MGSEGGAEEGGPEFGCPQKEKVPAVTGTHFFTGRILPQQ